MYAPLHRDDRAWPSHAVSPPATRDRQGSGVRTSVLLGETPRDSHEPSRPQVKDIEQALFTYRASAEYTEPVDVDQLTERVASAREAWNTSPSKYSILMRTLPGLVSDAEYVVSSASQRDMRNACRVASNAYILARGVLKHLGRIDLPHVAADRAIRYAGATDDPLLVGWTQWNLGQSLLSDDMNEGAYDIARHGIERLTPHVADPERAREELRGPA